jgi:hypothetical protein
MLADSAREERVTLPRHPPVSANTSYYFTLGPEGRSLGFVLTLVADAEEYGALRITQSEDQNADLLFLEKK